MCHTLKFKVENTTRESIQFDYSNSFEAGYAAS